MEKIKLWWKKSTFNEKLMYALLIVLVVGILTRWDYVWGEVGDAFGGLFSSYDEIQNNQTVTK